MEVVNETMPTSPERISAMQEPGPPGPIVMVNLLKFREQAQYADGRETDLTGAEAYALYGRAVAQLIQKFDGEIVFVSDVSFLSIGRVEDLWDQVALARYPETIRGYGYIKEKAAVEAKQPAEDRRRDFLMADSISGLDAAAAE